MSPLVNFFLLTGLWLMFVSSRNDPVLCCVCVSSSVWYLFLMLCLWWFDVFFFKQPSFCSDHNFDLSCQLCSSNHQTLLLFRLNCKSTADFKSDKTNWAHVKLFSSHLHSNWFETSLIFRSRVSLMCVCVEVRGQRSGSMIPQALWVSFLWFPTLGPFTAFTDTTIQVCPVICHVTDNEWPLWSLNSNLSH